MPNEGSRLIVNADDFGLSSDVNRGALEAVERGCVRSVTIMVNMRGFDEAVSSVHERDDVGVGLHLNITWGKPIAEPSRVRLPHPPEAFRGPGPTKGQLRSVGSRSRGLRSEDGEGRVDRACHFRRFWEHRSSA